MKKLQFANPDIAEAHGVAVILKDDRTCSVRFYGILRNTDVFSRTAQCNMILNQHTVVENSDCWRCEISAVGIEAGGGIHHIVHLPYARGFTGIDQRRMLLV